MKNTFLLLNLILLINLSRSTLLIAQCDVLSKDYSNSTGWTTAGTAVTITGGKVVYNQIPGQSDHRVYLSLGLTLGNTWAAEFDFNPQSGNNVGVAASLFCLTAGTQKPYKDPPYTLSTPWTNQDFIEVNVLSPHNTPNYITDTKIYAAYKDNSNSPVNSTPIDIPAWNQTYYVRIERISSTQGFLSVFSDQARTIHIPGSPQCFTIPSEVTGLNTLQHANIDQADADRRFSGWVDNSCIKSKVTPTNTYNTDFNIADKYCYGTSLVTSTNAPNVSNQWNFYECDVNCNIIGPELVYFVGNSISVPLTNSPFQPGHYYLIKHGVWSNCAPWQDATKCFQVLALPDAKAGTDLTLCPSTNGTKKIGAKAQLNTTYSWSPSNWLSNSTIAAPQPTLPSNIIPCVSQTYTLTVTNNITGCSATDNVNVTLINQAPSVSLSSTPCTWCVSPVLTATVTGSCNNSLLWSPGGATSQTISPLTNGIYTATVSNACFTTSASINAISPVFNGSLPDLSITSAATPTSPFIAFETGKLSGAIPSYNATSYNLKVFNAWGQVIHEQNGNATCATGFANGDISWNGICSTTGNYPPIDVFAYILTLNNCNSSRIYSGSLTFIYRLSPSLLDASNGEVELNIYPNPASDHATVVFAHSETLKEDFQLDLLNAAGTSVYSENIGIRKQLELRLYDLPEGIYLLRVRNIVTGKFVTQKMIIQRN